MTSATLAALRRRPESGSPQRSPSHPRPTTSIPRIRNDASKLRRCGRYPIRSPACPGRRPSTRTSPSAGNSPSNTFTSVDLPTPLGPNTATNSPAPTSRSTPDQSVRPPTRTAALRSETAGRVASGNRMSRLRWSRGRVWGGFHLAAALVRACWMPWSWRTCQSWKETPAGVGVSVTVATGMPFASAALTWAATSGVLFWLL